MEAKFCSMLGPAVDILQETVKDVSRENFYLWMYIAQEADYDDAFKFVNGKRREMTPFESMLRIGSSKLLNQQFWSQDDEDEF